MSNEKTVVLVILDGFGYNPDPKYNAISQANTPCLDDWQTNATHCLIDASGEIVGLPKDQMGNSEVGHMHIGAGRIIKQDLSRLNQAIESGDFYTNPVFKQAIDTAKEKKSAIHLVGLVSEGGVHSHQNHLVSLCHLLNEENIDNAYIHAILDGRDTPPQSALDSIEALTNHLAHMPTIKLASLCGRFYAMDRDNRWDRIEKAYNLYTSSHLSTLTAEQAINAAYQNKQSDEFIEPTPLRDFKQIEDNDVVILFNFRADRMRQLTHALVDKTFTDFQRQKTPKISSLVTMTQYESNLPANVAFPPITLTHLLGNCIADAGLKQLRLAETEKYAHVTFFFNGGQETPFTNEERVLIPSPKVTTYNLAPCMSAPEITNKLCQAIYDKKYSLIVCNYANADMVGHTGDMQATISAIECLDQCLEKVGKAVFATDSDLLITADHGNAEMMFNESAQQNHTAHTALPVPFLHIGHRSRILKQNNTLIDIAPTVLSLLGLKIPEEMTGDLILELTDTQ